MNKAYLLIGGNLGNTMNVFQQVFLQLDKQVGTIVKKSSVYVTAPWGNPEQQDFLNQAILILTPLDAKQLMQLLLKIEESLGRQRIEKYGPRIIDIDILFFNDEIINDPGLIIPHPQLQNRRFALIPLAEIAPNLYHPILNKTIADLIAECSDDLEVSLLE
jgi:2-amino-4-hydroxy-6-hydroxymethyldihydropteridine diphosphokinase